jgi:Fe2+ or Zn2+ uptake regulation protein
LTAPTTSDRLREAGERVTRQRIAVADALTEVGRQVSAQELYRRLRRRDPGIGRATVFRTLEALVAAGVARRLERDGHVYGYVACRPEHHHHLACDRCGRVEEIDEAYIRPVAERVAVELGFRIDDARVDFYGLCANCARRG